MPGTAGFVADDLRLHTLRMESPASTVTVILSSALLAVSTLVCYPHVFLGKATLPADAFLSVTPPAVAAGIEVLRP